MRPEPKTGFLGGIDPEALCETWGIPLYVYDSATMLEQLAAGRTLPKIRRGDLLAFHNAGAYGASMASNYNSRLRPAEVLLQGGGARMIRRRETLDDLLSTQPGA